MEIRARVDDDFSIACSIRGRIEPNDVPSLCERVRALLERRPPSVLVCDLDGLVGVDLAVVDALARLQLTARRMGCEVRLQRERSDVSELLDLTGLRSLLEVLDA